MNKKISSIIFAITGILAFFIYGCCSHSDSGIFVNPQGDTHILQRNVVVDNLGRIPTVTFPSGATFEGTKENTLKPGTKVTIIEQEVKSLNLAYFTEYDNSNLFIYKIIANQDSSSSASSKNYVTTIEKPITAILPANSDTSKHYLGIMESDTDPWRFSRVIAQNENAPSNECTFNLYKLGNSFCLAAYSESNDNKMPPTIVESFTASSTGSIPVKDGKYAEDIQIKGIFEGLNLGNINPSDFRVRITYRSNTVNTAPIKVNGANVTQKTKEDKSVPGYSYSHSFEINSFDDYSLTNTNGDFALTLNLKGIETNSFPTSFLLDFYNKINDEKVLPYNFTELYTLNGREAVNISVTADINKIDEDSGLYELNPTFLIAIDRELSNSDKEKIETAISVSNIEPEKITKNWNGNNLTIGFIDDLEPETTYTLSVANITNIEGITFDKVEDLTFKTKALTINSFSITYNLNGGFLGQGLSNPKLYGTASESFSLVNPVKEGAIFSGWTGSNGDTPEINVIIEQGSTGNKTFTANYTYANYNISYELNGGQEVTPNPRGYDYSSDTIILVPPIKDNYTFIGWTGSNGDTPQINVIVGQGSTGDKSYTANWGVGSYRVTLNKGTGINEVSGEGTYKLGENVIASCTCLEGYEFDFWTGNSNESEFTMPNHDVVMQANAKVINYSIECHLEGGDVIAPNQVSYNVTSDDIPLINPTKNGYIFKGWSGTDLVGTDNLNVSIPHGSMGNREYTAHYKPKAYTISYNLVYGSLEGGETNPTSYDITSSTILLNKPVRRNYNFVGWTGTGIDGIASDVTIVQGSYENREYVASWTIADVITFDLSNDVTIELKRCPAGTFIMGSPEDEPGAMGYPSERPQHNVTISSFFYMGTYEVTQAQYFAAIGTNPSSHTAGVAANERPTITANRPVERVSWDDAKAFCRWLNDNTPSELFPDGYRFDLPTEAQWEYACRAGTTTSLNSGLEITDAWLECQNLNEVAWNAYNCGTNRTNDVGQKLQNNWGLYDMHGNVWEWCRDYYTYNYYTDCGDCVDPLGPDYPPIRVLRGGGWQLGNPIYCRSAYRSSPMGQSGYTDYVGFRIALVKN